MRGRYRWGVLAPAAATLLVLSGCSEVVNGSASFDSATTGAPPSSAGSAPGSAPTASTPSAPASAPSTPAASSGSATSTGGDFTNVDFVTPHDFVKPTGYSVAVPLEAHHISVFFTPEVSPQGLDVLSVFLYELPATGLADTPAEQLRRVKQYNLKSQARVIGTIRKSTLAGRPALTESVTQPPNYNYVTWFTFGSRHMLQLSCQYDKPELKSTIDQGCTALRSSLTLS